MELTENAKGRRHGESPISAAAGSAQAALFAPPRRFDPAQPELAGAAARTVIMSPIIGHDAPQSCRAAFIVEELRALAQRAGLKRFTIDRHHGPFRMILSATK